MRVEGDVAGDQGGVFDAVCVGVVDEFEGHGQVSTSAPSSAVVLQEPVYSPETFVPQ